jgi:RNA polymerase sigma-70 factor, ECF subfamily
LKAFSNLASFRGEAKFSTWLVQITYNEAKMKLRRPARTFTNRSTIDRKMETEETIALRTLRIGGPYRRNYSKVNEMREIVQNAINSLSSA